MVNAVTEYIPNCMECVHNGKGPGECNPMNCPKEKKSFTELDIRKAFDAVHAPDIFVRMFFKELDG